MQDRARRVRVVDEDRRPAHRQSELSPTRTSPGGNGLRVLLAEPQRLVRQSLVAALAARDGVAFVAAAATLPETMRAIRTRRHDVLVLNAQMVADDVAGGLAALQDITAAIATVIIGAKDHDGWLVDALDVGVRGYLNRGNSLQHLASVIFAVGRGEVAVPRRLQATVLDGMRERRHEHAEALAMLMRLTAQEQRVLRLLVEGGTNDYIGAELGISPQTARTHVEHLISKLGVHSRLEVVTFVLHNRFLADLVMPSART